MMYWSYFLLAVAFFVFDDSRSSSKIFVNAQEGTEDEATFQNCVTWINLVDSNDDSLLSKSEYDILVEVGLGGCMSTLVESIYWNFACPNCDNAIDNEQCCPKDDAGSVVPLDASRFTFCAIVTTAIKNTCPLETTSPTNGPTNSPATSPPPPTPVPSSSDTDNPTSTPTQTQTTPVPSSSETDNPTSTPTQTQTTLEPTQTQTTLEPTQTQTTLEPTPSPTPGPTTSQPSMATTTIVPSPTPSPTTTSTAAATTTTSLPEAENQSLVVAFRVQFYDDTDPATRNNDDIDNVMWDLLNTAFDYLATEAAILTTATIDIPTTIISTTIDEWIPPTTCITTTAPDNNNGNNNKKQATPSSQFFCATGRLVIEVQFSTPEDDASLLTETVAMEEFQSTLLDFAASDDFTMQLEQLLLDEGYALEFVQFVPVLPPPSGEDDDVITTTDKPTSPPTSEKQTNNEGEEDLQDEGEDGGNNSAAIIIAVIVIGVVVGLVAAMCCCFDRIECCGYQIECCFYDDNDSAIDEDGATAAAEENGQKDEDKLNDKDEQQQGEGMENGISSRAVDGGPSSMVGKEPPSPQDNISSRTNNVSSSSNPTTSNDKKKELASTSPAVIDGDDDDDDDDDKKEMMQTNVDDINKTAPSHGDGGYDVHVFEDQEEELQEQRIPQTNDGDGEISSTDGGGTFDPRFNPYPLPAEARAIHPLPANFPSLPYGYPGGTLPAYAPPDPTDDDILSPEPQAAPSKSLSSSPSKKLVDAMISAQHSHSGEDPAEQHQRQNMSGAPTISSSASGRQQPGQASKEGGEQQQRYYDGVYYGSLDEEDKEKQQSQQHDIDRPNGFLKAGADLDSNPNLVHAV